MTALQYIRCSVRIEYGKLLDAWIECLRLSSVKYKKLSCRREATRGASCH